MLKHYENRGFSNVLCFCCWKGRKQAKKNDNWNFWIAETPIFIVFLGCALLGPSCQKKEILDTHPKKKKILTDNWKAHFWVFFGFSCFFSFFVCFFFFYVLVVFVFLEGLRVMWGGRRATSLGPKPSLFVCLGFVLFLIFFVFFKGQVRWPEGPPHLALNPTYSFIYFFGGGGFGIYFGSFPFFVFNRKNTVFALKRAFFVYFSLSPFLSP